MVSKRFELLLQVVNRLEPKRLKLLKTLAEMRAFFIFADVLTALDNSLTSTFQGGQIFLPPHFFHHPSFGICTPWEIFLDYS